MRSTLPTAALAVLVVLAGCAGGTSIGSPGTADSPGSNAATDEANTGTVQFYVSDRPQAIDEFQHLNVTISKVGIQKGGENGNWTEFDVDSRTVDLTRLRGNNATLLDEFALANGTYTKVFVHVSEVQGTLTSGEQVNVKLPSEKLQLNKPFAVRPNESVDFVFDIAVHKAGKSGKYILRPVIGESGTDVPIDDVDDGHDRDGLNVSVLGNVTRGEDATIGVTENGSAVANATVVVNDEEIGTTGSAGKLSFDVPADVTELTVEITAGDADAELEVEFESESENGNQ